MDLPTGIFPFFMSNQAAEDYGLKNGPGISDLVRRKKFNTGDILKEIQRLGFMCAFEPCEKQLKACGLDQFVIVCDSTSTYGEMFLLLYNQDAIDKFRSEAEQQDLAAIVAAEKAKKESDERDDEEMKKKKAIYIEAPIAPQHYSSQTEEETSLEVEIMSFRPKRKLVSYMVSRPVSMLNRNLNLDDMGQEEAGYLDFRPQKIPEFDVHSLLKDVGIQAIDRMKTGSSQTVWSKKVHKSIQYEHLTFHDFGYSSDDIWENVGNFLQKVVLLVECALQENETVDVYADYLEIRHREESIDFSLENESKFKELRNFTDLEYNKGKILTSIDWYPGRSDLIAASACQTNCSNEYLALGKPTSSFISIWHFANQIHPILVLGSPLDCTFFRFNPTLPSIVIAGCINGQVIMWRLVDIEKFIATSTVSETNVQCSTEKNNQISPVALTHPEFSHKRMVSDITWLPAHIQINVRGQILSNEYLSEETNQFITVSGNVILFWDIRFEDILMGKHPYIAKPKVIKKSTDPSNFDNEFMSTSWAPLFKIKVKRLEGTGELSFCKVSFSSKKKNEVISADERDSQIICTSEEGDFFMVDWLPNNQSEKDTTESKDPVDTSPTEFVQWMRKDHNRPPFSLQRSPFFSDIYLSVADSNFNIWESSCELETPLFSSPFSTVHLTGGRWSITRPGIIFISKADGAIDVWDFTDTCYNPLISIPLTTNRIVSMELLDCKESILNKNDFHQLLAIGDNLGSLHLFDLPRKFVKMQPREYDIMKEFFSHQRNYAILNCKTEEKSKGSMVDELAEEETISRDKCGESCEDWEENLTEEEEKEYYEFELECIQKLGISQENYEA